MNSRTFVFIRMLQEIKLASYIENYGENWADNLPAGCPPEDVCIANEDVFFRMTFEVDSIQPKDWYNHLALFPERIFSDSEKLFAAGLSLLDTIEEVERKRKLPGTKHLKGTARISLVPEDGVVLQTGRRVHHFTWWRTTMCNLSKAQIV